MAVRALLFFTNQLTEFERCTITGRQTGLAYVDGRYIIRQMGLLKRFMGSCVYGKLFMPIPGYIFKNLSKVCVDWVQLPGAPLIWWF